MRAAILVYPGSNCDHDAYHVLRHVLGADARFVWHKETSLEGFDAAVVPGGFSYGDYLRCGAIAKFSPISRALVAFAEAGRPVIGICNGFQILVETGLLPGALMRNQGLSFLCQDVHLRVETTDAPFLRAAREGAVLRMPIAHGDGNYFADDETLARLEGEGRVALRYAAPDGTVDPDDEESNPNGSLAAIAGIVNEQRNVLGLMPHPERASEPILGSADGRVLFDSLLAAVGA